MMTAWQPLHFQGAPVPVSPFWQAFVTPAIRAELARMAAGLVGEDFTPPPALVLRFLAMERVVGVILGQDPYPARGAATGRAFESQAVTSWAQPIRQTSLINIAKNLYRTYVDPAVTDLTIGELREAIAAGRFPIQEPGELFADWERQGVLLLNTALTCQVGAPGSHAERWRAFTAAVLRYLCAQAPDAFWLLWGGNAISYRDRGLITSPHVYTCCHPRLPQFMRGDGFAQTQDRVHWLGVR